MVTALVVVFILAYAAIALEHPIRINKSASALIGAGLLWTIYSLMADDPRAVEEQLRESIGQTAGIVFFLLAAMTIVEVVDAHDGFELITRRVRTSNLSKLIWLVSIITFFLSAVLDNLTTTIVMVSLMRKLLEKHEDRLLFAGVIVIAANSGGAWSPMGDVTTTMLWIGGQITALEIVKGVLLPSIVSMVLPVAVVAYALRGHRFDLRKANAKEVRAYTGSLQRNTMFFAGIGILLIVPLFKTVTHLPPSMGILFGLGLLWLLGDLLHRDTRPEIRQRLTLTHALSRIDMSSIVFFVGILLAVATLEHTHVLRDFAQWLDTVIGSTTIIVLLIGMLSAIVDNVPLVAASMGMYSLSQFPPDDFFWEFLAYCAGTGGSILIIGSAAGIAAMGLEKIHFFWYLKRISWLALIGYLAGAATYVFQYRLLH